MITCQWTSEPPSTDAELGFPDGYLERWRSGSTEPWTVDVLVSIAKAVKPRNILETGTFEGRTTRRLWEVLGVEGRVHTVEQDPERFADVSSKIDQLGIELYNLDALDFINMWQKDPFDFVFLDDDHNANHVAAEIDALYNPTQPETAKVAPGGIICVHDVVGPFGLDAIVIARKGFILDLPRLHAGGGLGIIQLPR